MKVQVTYISSTTDFLVEVELADGALVTDAIILSDVLNKHPEISLQQNKVGVFGEIVSENYVLKEGDRIEIYRPLSMDPMQARRLRANQ
ncbi:MAG: RnfH family protein [Pseudomonadota bacterium]